jgi:geranylgeranyl transferase type-2 subunit beta
MPHEEIPASMRGYLEQLTLQLAEGVGRLSPARRDRSAAYLRSQQQPDGGFAGRQGGSDLYYTGFALRGLAVMGQLEGELAQGAAGFLQGRLAGSESIIDFLSLVYGAKLLELSAGIDVMRAASPQWRESVEQLLERLRGPDGGYTKGTAGTASSTYHTFLVLLCRQLIERPVPHPEKIVAFIHSQQDDAGGFREIRVSKRAGTNPTAAAIGTLQILDGLTEGVQTSSIDFLLEMQTDEGGLRANTRIPVADLLSTFTGLLTLQQLGAADQLDLPAVRGYVLGLQDDRSGAFAGASLDTGSDVEYTFYGIGSLALLALLGCGDEPWLT